MLMSAVGLALLAAAAGSEPLALETRVTVSERGSTRGTAYAAANKIVTIDGRTHVSWLDSGSITMIQTFDASGEALTEPVEVGRGLDNHGGPALCADSQGHLHIFFGPHHGPFQYRRTVRPNDITEWAPVEEIGDTATYPSVVCDSQDTLHLVYRGGAAPWKLMYQRKPKEGAWTPPVALMKSPVEKGYTQWGNALTIDAQDRLHLAFHFYDVELHKAGFAWSYLYSDDGGVTWRTASGKPIELPGTIETCEPVLNGDAIDLRMGNCSVAPDGVVYATVLHYTKGSSSELWKLEDGKWTAIALTPVVREFCAGPADANPVREAVVHVGTDGTVYVALTVGAGSWGAPGQEVALLVSRDAGATFSVHRVSPVDEETPNWLPNIERNVGRPFVDRPHLVYTHGHPGETCTPDIKTEIVFVTLPADLP